MKNNLNGTKYIKDPRPFKAKDGSYYATMREVERANNDYFRRAKESLVSVKKQILTDEEYCNKMRELGFVEDPEFGKFFLGDMAFLMNLDDDINELGDLIKMNGNNPTYTSQVLIDFSMRGADLIVGSGAIDEYGVRQKRALYCTNYRELYSSKNKKI